MHRPIHRHGLEDSRLFHRLPERIRYRHCFWIKGSLPLISAQRTLSPDLKVTSISMSDVSVSHDCRLNIAGVSCFVQLSPSHALEPSGLISSPTLAVFWGVTGSLIQPLALAYPMDSYHFTAILLYPLPYFISLLVNTIYWESVPV